MAWTPPAPRPKITVTALNDSTAKTWNETLGYSKFDVFDSEAGAGVAAQTVKTFAQNVISQLTNGVYQKANVVYEVNLDELEF